MESILLVDDDPINNFVTCRLLDMSRICKKLCIAPDGRSAINFLKNIENPKPDLILLDLLMPVMNGMEFLEEKEEVINNNCPIVILSVLNERDIRQTIDNSGDFNVAGCIPKPLDVNELISILKVIPGLKDNLYVEDDDSCLVVEGVGGDSFVNIVDL